MQQPNMETTIYGMIFGGTPDEMNTTWHCWDCYEEDVEDSTKAMYLIANVGEDDITVACYLTKSKETYFFIASEKPLTPEMVKAGKQLAQDVYLDWWNDVVDHREEITSLGYYL